MHSDLPAVVRLLAQCGDPTQSLPLAERKRRFVRGLLELVPADMWIWTAGARNPDLPGDAMAFSILDDGWIDDVERAAVLRVITNPEQTVGVFESIHHALQDGRAATVVRHELFSDDVWQDLPVGQLWRSIGFDHFLVTAFPVGSNAYSALGLHRRVGRPAFTDRERSLLEAVFCNAAWLHQEPADLPAAERAVALSPRERQVMLLLIGGDSRKQVAGKLQLSEHTVADYLKEIYRKFGVSSRGELLAQFIAGDQ